MHFAFCLYKHFPYSGLSLDMLRIANECTQRGHKATVFTGSWEGDVPVGVEVVIVKHFGLETLDVIDNEPERLLEVGGTGPKRVDTIKKGWDEQRHVKEVMLFLQSHGVSTGFAIKIYKKYCFKPQKQGSYRPKDHQISEAIIGTGCLQFFYGIAYANMIK